MLILLQKSGKVRRINKQCCFYESMEAAGWKNTLDDFDKSLRVNASALFKITQMFAEDMKKNSSGSIINIGSMMGTVGVENGNYEGTDFTPATSPLYFYEKGGMHNFTRWAASMLGPFNIRVNCLAPGGFKVSITSRAIC